MESYRNNVKGPMTTGDDCFRSMQRHTTAKSPAATAKPVQTAPIAAPAVAAPIAGDIIYGAKAIAGFIFGDTGKRAVAASIIFGTTTKPAKNGAQGSSS